MFLLPCICLDRTSESGFLYVRPAHASSETQKWKFDDKGRIVSLFNGLAVRWDSSTNQATLVDKSKGQSFMIGCNSPSYFFLQNMKSGKVLGVANTDVAAGALVNMYDKNIASGMPFEQLWKFRDGYLLSAVSDSKVRGESLVLDANGEAMQLQGMNETDGQLWNFKFDFTGVAMTNLKNDKFLDGGYAGTFKDWNGTLNQKWWMVKVNDFKGAMVMTIEFDPG